MEKKINLPEKGTGEKNEVPFKGYTMEELRYNRAMVALKKEFCQAKLTENINKLRGRNESEGVKKERHPKLALAGRIASIVFSNLNTLDYVLMGMSLFGSMKKGAKLIRGRKK